MSRVMFDSTNINDIPLTAQMVGYYIDGIYATTAAVVRVRFPHAILVPISAVGTDNGIVGDVEPGCMTVSQGVTWVKMRRLANADPTIYCNEMNAWSGIRQAFRNAGVAEPHYWVADYDNIAVLPAGTIAKQYANPTLTGGHYDKSIVADTWPGVDTMGTTAENEIQELYDAFQGGPDYFSKLIGTPLHHGAWYNLVATHWVALNTRLDQLNAKLDAIQAAVAAIPAGSAGPQGPAGPAGVVPDHHHVVSTTSTMVP